MEHKEKGVRGMVLTNKSNETSHLFCSSTANRSTREIMANRSCKNFEQVIASVTDMCKPQAYG